MRLSPASLEAALQAAEGDFVKPGDPASLRATWRYVAEKRVGAMLHALRGDVALPRSAAEALLTALTDERVVASVADALGPRVASEALSALFEALQ